MAQLEKKTVAPNHEVLSVLDYIDKYHEGLSPQAVSYAMDNDKIDYVRFGHERLIVMTEKTRSYTPNESNKRGVAPPRAVRGTSTTIQI